MRIVGIALCVAAPLCVIGSAAAQDVWVGKDGCIRNMEARALSVSAERSFMATTREAYVLLQDGKRWHAVFSLPSGNNEIQCVQHSGAAIFIGTRRGLFRSDDGGRSWRSVFRTVITEKSSVLSIVLLDTAGQGIVIGTEHGVYISNDSGAHWQDAGGALKNRRVSSVRRGGNALYACTDDGVYRMPAGSKGWSRMFVLSQPEKNGADDAAEAGAAIDEDSESGRPACVAIQGADLYIGMGSRIVYSADDGLSWKAFASQGLGGKINDILIGKDGSSIYCATTKGLFGYRRPASKWHELYKSTDRKLLVTGIRFTDNSERAIWAIASDGLYMIDASLPAEDTYGDVEMKVKNFTVTYNNEPGFRQLQQAALRYAEVDPDKILWWRRQARLSALVPKISIGFDSDRSNTYEIYTSSTKDYVVSGPDDISEGMGVTISWELGNLIWSDDQTNIDVRSRLTTQLRNDILDDLRRIYYERKRLVYELLSGSPKDEKLRFEKELRVQELTQAIDDLTGNYLSDNSCPAVK